MNDRQHAIGFIGLGSMGGDQARELVKLPNVVTVYDNFPAAAARFEGKAKIAGSIAEVGATSDVVGVCVRDDAQVNDCVRELLPAMQSGSKLLIHSTVRPQTIVAIHEQASPLGISVMDAPVSRTEMTKDGPFVYCMTGGDTGLASEVEYILAAFSTDIIHIGRLGSAMALKICNNIASWCQITLGLEIAEIADGAGVPLDKLSTVMNRNGVMSPPMQGFMEFWRDPGDAAKRDFFASQAGIGEKDLSLAEKLAEESGTSTPVTSHMKTLVKQSILAVCESKR